MDVHGGLFQCETTVGTGSFGTVYLAKHKASGTRVAVKVIEEDRIATMSDRMCLTREVAILQTLDHPFIGKVFSVDFERDQCVIIQEFLPQGTLLEMLMRDGPMAETQIRYYFVQLVAAMDYLHNSKKVAHRDLKLENIMLDHFGNLQLIDFGLSRAFSETENQFTTPCGSPPYLAPEIITEGSYTQAADVWSLGIVLYALATANLPFYDDNITTLCRQIISCEVHYPMSLGDDLADLLHRMLCRDPAERITIEQIKEHPFFPTEHYAAIVESAKAIMGYDFEAEPDVGAFRQLDEDVVFALRGCGIDCSHLAAAVRGGEKDDTAILYNIFLRQEHSEKMNRVLKSSYGLRLGSTAHGSSPALRPLAAPLPPIVMARQNKRPIFVPARPPSPDPSQFRRTPGSSARGSTRPEVVRRKRPAVPLPPTMGMGRRALISGQGA
jgi:serine/threonine protein kinase